MNSNYLFVTLHPSTEFCERFKTFIYYCFSWLLGRGPNTQNNNILQYEILELHLLWIILYSYKLFYCLTYNMCKEQSIAMRCCKMFHHLAERFLFHSVTKPSSFTEFTLSAIIKGVNYYLHYLCCPSTRVDKNESRWNLLGRLKTFTPCLSRYLEVHCLDYNKDNN